MGVKTQVSVGDRYGRLEVVRELAPKPICSGKFHRIVECLCDCGTVKVFHLYRLRSGNTKSCGCLRRDTSGTWNVIHGKTGSAEWVAWAGMKGRCTNPKSSSYGRYGGRGIKVCQRWLDSFTAFFNDMGSRPSPYHSIDRIDNDGDYEPGNCRWATTKEQSRNTSRTVLVTHAGETLCVSEWADRYGISPSLLHSRLHYGCSFEEAVSRPLWSDESFYRTPISQRDAAWYREYEARQL